MALTVSIDGKDLSTLGFSVRRADTRRATTPRVWPSQSVANKAPRVRMSDRPQTEGRQLEVIGQLKGTSDSNFESRRDEILARCRAGEVEVTFSDGTRIYYGRFLGADHGMLTRADLNFDEVALTWELLYPWAYASSTSSVTGIGSTATDIPLGTAPSLRDVTVQVNGTFTDPTVQYLASDGTTVFSASFTLSKSSSEWIKLDMEAGTIVDDTGTSQIDALDTGSDFPWALDPNDGVYWNSNWPQMKVTDGTLDVTLRKAYE